MQRKYWLSYDLGVGGDYKGLYQWLDDHNAESCGSSVAFFTYEIPNEQEGDETLKSDLLEIMLACAEGNLADKKISWSKDSAVCANL